MSVPKPVAQWSPEDVQAWICSIGLDSLKEAFAKNGVNGSDLIALTDDDMTESLGMSGLQVKKVRRELETNWGIHAPGGAPAAAAAAPPSAAAPEAAPIPVPVAAPPPAAAAPAPDAGARMQQLQAEAAEAQRSAQAFATAQQYLRRAEEELQRAVKSLGVAKFSGATETIQDVRIGARGGGLFGRNRGAGHAMDRRNDFGHNMIEMGTVNKANAMVKEAAVNISHAKQAVPQLPFIQPARVQQAMSGVMLNVFFQGVMGDIMQQNKIKRAQAEVQEMHNEVVQALDWCNNNLNAAQMKAQQCQGAMMG